ncbi:MAG: PilW family protein [Verrucomicrobiia bacterium]
MHTREHTFPGRARGTALRLAPALPKGFSLIELLTAVSILMVIIYALYAMFNQTQKALRANITQVDVLESGRAAAEMLGRELEQLAASQLSQTINLYAGMTPGRMPMPQHGVDQNAARAPLRTNILQEFFFLSRETNKWVGTGYRVMGADVGTLYRFSTSTNYYELTFTNLMSAFVHTPMTNAAGVVHTNFNRMTEGVIHLRLTAYDPDGLRLDATSSSSTNMHPNYRILRLDPSGRTIGLVSSALAVADANVILQPDPVDPFRRETRFMFTSNALPGYIELELGVLEPATLKQYRSLLDSPKAAESFLKNQAGKVHLFRQRIPIRTALP